MKFLLACNLKKKEHTAKKHPESFGADGSSLEHPLSQREESSEAESMEDEGDPYEPMIAALMGEPGYLADSEEYGLTSTEMLGGYDMFEEVQEDWA